MGRLGGETRWWYSGVYRGGFWEQRYVGIRSMLLFRLLDGDGEAPSQSVAMAVGGHSETEPEWRRAVAVTAGVEMALVEV